MYSNYHLFFLITLLKYRHKQETPLTNTTYMEVESMARKIRSDCTVGTLEKKYGLPAGTIRNKDGRDTRSDKLVGTIRKEAARKIK